MTLKVRSTSVLNMTVHIMPLSCSPPAAYDPEDLCELSWTNHDRSSTEAYRHAYRIRLG